MAGRPAGREKIKKNTVEIMKSLGTYRSEYDPIIEVYADLREEYQRLNTKWKKEGYEHSDRTAAGGGKKSPLVSTLEVLRRDILAYSDRLCLNPKSMMESGQKKGKKKSRLDAALAQIE